MFSDRKAENYVAWLVIAGIVHYLLASRIVSGIAHDCWHRLLLLTSRVVPEIGCYCWHGGWSLPSPVVAACCCWHRPWLLTSCVDGILYWIFVHILYHRHDCETEKYDNCIWNEEERLKNCLFTAWICMIILLLLDNWQGEYHDVHSYESWEQCDI